MKKLSLKQIIPAIKGSLVKGNPKMIIQDVIHSHHMNQLSTPNTLLFVSSPWQLNINLVRQMAPCAVVVSQPSHALLEIYDCTIIQVNNVDQSYFSFVNYYRDLFDIPVFGITGTCGKTTTKDMIKHITSQFYQITGTNKSSNGPSHHLEYLLGMNELTQVAVFETAVGMPNSLKLCKKYFKPTIGILTNIGIDHLDHCKTLEGYIKAKGEIVNMLDRQGILILNADDENTKKVNLKPYKGKIIYFGIEQDAHFKGSNIKFVQNGMAFTLTYQNKNYEVFVPGYGVHQVYNCLAALAGVTQLGISLENSIKTLTSFQLIERHLQVNEGINHSLIIDDTYSLNPTSLEAALKTLSAMSQEKRKILFLSDIATLGDKTIPIHYQVGEMIAKYDFDVLVTMGTDAKIIADQCVKNGFTGQVFSFRDLNGVRPFLVSQLNNETILLLKCSMFDADIQKMVKSLYS